MFEDVPIFPSLLLLRNFKGPLERDGCYTSFFFWKVLIKELQCRQDGVFDLAT